MTIGFFLLLALAIMLGVAWYDGGREQQRLIVKEVSLPEGNS